MIDFFTAVINKVINGGPRVHLMALVACTIISIILIRVIFFKLLKSIANKTGISLDILQQTTRGIPTLCGVIFSIYVAMETLVIPERPLMMLQKVYHSIIIITITLMISHLGSGFLKQKFEKTNGIFSSTSILATIIDIVVYSIGSVFLLETFGISITPLLTALGVGGLAVALALQDTLSNLFSGINILLSRQVKMGDYVKLTTGEEGHVVDMNWRNTTIKSPTENMVVVPNKNIASTIFINYAQPYAECSISIPVGVSYDSDLYYVEKVTLEIAKEVLKEIEGGVVEFEPSIRYHSFAESSINFNVNLRVKTVTDQWLVRHEFIKKLHLRYRQEGIVIPYPIRSVIMNNNHAG